MGEKAKVLDEHRTSVQASCNGLRAAILGEGWELVHLGMSPAYPDGVCAMPGDQITGFSLPWTLTVPESVKPLNFTSLIDLRGCSVWRHCGKMFLLVLLTIFYVSVFKEGAKSTSEVPTLPTLPSTAST